MVWWYGGTVYGGSKRFKIYGILRATELNIGVDD